MTYHDDQDDLRCSHCGYHINPEGYWWEERNSEHGGILGRLHEDCAAEYPEEERENAWTFTRQDHPAR